MFHHPLLKTLVELLKKYKTECVSLASNKNYSLHTLYAQSWRIILVPPVLPRVLAGPNFLETIIIRSKTGFYNNNVFFIQTIWLGQALAHCPRFLTAASTPESGPCLSPNVAVQPLSPAKHDWLGVLLITPTT